MSCSCSGSRVLCVALVGVLGLAAVCAQGCSADDSAESSSHEEVDASADDARMDAADAGTDAAIDAATNASDAWTASDADSGLGSDAIADAASDAVVDAGAVTVETWGYPTPFGSSQSVSLGSVLAYKITTSSTTTLDKLGLIAPQAGGDFKMALYTDTSNAPGTLVSWIDTRQTVGAPGVAEVDVVDHQVLSAGSYWLAVRAAPSVTVGYSGVSPTATICSRNLAMMNLDTAWPVSFGAATCSTAGILNLYIVTFK